MRTKRIKPGSYRAWTGRGRNRRTFLIERHGANDDGWSPGWSVIEIEIERDGSRDWKTVHGDGLATKAGAIQLAAAEAA